MVFHEVSFIYSAIHVEKLCHLKQTKQTRVVLMIQKEIKESAQGNWNALYINKYMLI